MESLEDLKNKNKIRNELWKIAYPLILSNASFTLSIFVQRIFLSWYSKDALSAAIPGGVLQFNITCFFIGLVSYSSVLIAHFFGRKEVEKMRHVFWSGVSLAIISVLFVISLMPLGHYIINHSGHPLHVIKFELVYFDRLLIGGMLALLKISLIAWFSGQGKTFIIMIVDSISSLCAIFLSYFFIFGISVKGKMVLPDMGINGAGYAVILANSFTLIIYILLLFKMNRELFDISKNKVDKIIFKMLCRFGIPNGAGIFLDIMAFSVFVFLMGNIDELSMNANSMILSLELLAFLPILGLGTATSILVGKYLGMKEKENAKKVVSSSIRLALFYAFIVGFIFVICGEYVLKLFVHNDQEQFSLLYPMMQDLLKILALYIFIDAIQNIYANAIKGGGDTRFHMIANLVIAWSVFVPGTALCVFYLKLSMQYAWGVASIYASILAFTYYVRYKSMKWEIISKF